MSQEERPGSPGKSQKERAELPRRAGLQRGSSSVSKNQGLSCLGGRASNADPRLFLKTKG